MYGQSSAKNLMDKFFTWNKFACSDGIVDILFDLAVGDIRAVNFNEVEHPFKGFL